MSQLQTFRLILDEIENVQIKEIYDDLIEKLKYKDFLKEEMLLYRELATISQDRFNAGKLYIISTRNLKKQKRIFESVFARLSDLAMKNLQSLKDRGKYSRQITEQAIKNYLLQNHKVEYVSAQKKLHDAEIIVDTMKILYDLWKDRGSYLQSIKGLMKGES